MTRTRVITDPEEIAAAGICVGDLVTERVTDVGSQTDNGHFDGQVVRIEREVPDETTLTVLFAPKTIREALCVAEHAVNQHVTQQNRHSAPQVLAALIRECDRHRPLGPNGKHGDRHTSTCGCDDPSYATPRPLPTREQVAREVHRVDVIRADATTDNWADLSPAMLETYYAHADAILALLTGDGMANISKPATAEEKPGIAEPSPFNPGDVAHDPNECGDPSCDC